MPGYMLVVLQSDGPVSIKTASGCRSCAFLDLGGDQ